MPARSVTRTPAKTSNAKVDAVGRRVKTKGEPALAMYADRKITPVMESFVEFIEAQTGYKPDALSVQLGSALRGQFQKSEGNQARIASRAEERAAEEVAKQERRDERAQRKADREAAAAEKAATPKATKAAPAKKAPAAKSAPAKAAKPTDAKPLKSAATPRARAAKAAADTSTKTASSTKAATTGKVTPLAGRRRPVAKSSTVEDF